MRFPEKTITFVHARLKQKDRQDIINAFQVKSGNAADVLVGPMGILGTGYTLTRARQIVICTAAPKGPGLLLARLIILWRAFAPRGPSIIFFEICSASKQMISYQSMYPIRGFGSIEKGDISVQAFKQHPTFFWLDTCYHKNLLCTRLWETMLSTSNKECSWDVGTKIR